MDVSVLPKFCLNHWWYSLRPKFKFCTCQSLFLLQQNFFAEGWDLQVCQTYKPLKDILSVTATYWILVIPTMKLHHWWNVQLTIFTNFCFSLMSMIFAALLFSILYWQASSQWSLIELLQHKMMKHCPKKWSESTQSITKTEDFTNSLYLLLLYGTSGTLYPWSVLDSAVQKFKTIPVVYIVLSRNSFWWYQANLVTMWTYRVLQTSNNFLIWIMRIALYI